MSPDPKTPIVDVQRVPHQTLVIAKCGTFRVVTEADTGARLQINVPSLDDVETAYLASVLAVLCDPAMADTRRRLRAGELFICIEGDEVTFTDAEAVADDLAARLACAAAAKEGS